jgi:CHAD domain-containing protein
LIKALKTLQEVLGDFQDLEVQQLSLKRFSQEMSAEGQVPAETLMAMGILIHNLGERQQQARDAFAQRFSTFASQQNQSAFRELFAATVQAEAA